MISDEVDLVKAVFGNQNGEKLLEIWRQVYINRPSYEPGRPSEDCIYFEGQRSQVLSILQMMEMKDE